MATSTYKFYPKELREQAIRESLAPGAVRREVSDRLNLDDQVVARWIREELGTSAPTKEEIAAYLGEGLPSPAPQAPQGEDLTKLRATVATAKAERDLLKGLLSHYMQRG